jgi:hypothetical protein
VMLQTVASLTDDSRGIVYNCNIFTTQATDFTVKNLGSNPITNVFKRI